MGLWWRPPAYLAPLPHDAPKTKVHWESPRFLFLDLRGTNTHMALDSLPVLHFAVHLLPCSADNTSFKLQDGWLLNELTLCISDRLLVAHFFEADLAQRGFLFTIFLSLPCVLLVVFCFLFPHLFFRKRSNLKARLFSIHHLFIPFATQFLYFHNMSL